METIKENIMLSILDAYPYEIVFVDLDHIVRYMNKTAKRHYGDRVKIGASLFNCHNENARSKIEAFLERAKAGEDEMYENYSSVKGEREFFVPVRNEAGEVIGYFERHEVYWKEDDPREPVGDYWKRRR